MLGLRVAACLLTASLLLHCGGDVAADSSSAAPGQEPAAGGASGALDECGGAAPDGGCDGVAGQKPLESYARLRTACSLNVRVNRNGTPICIDYHIR